MSFGGVLLAMSAVKAITEIGQGKAQQAEANYNATLLEGKANMIGAQAEIDYGQYNRKKGKALSTSMATIAGAGIAPGGSAMAVMLDAQTQINIDQAIGQFNYEQEKQYTLNEASQARRKGNQAVSSGYSNAFSTMLQGASNYAMYKGGGTQITSVGTIKDTTFDTVPVKYSDVTRYYNQGKSSAFSNKYTRR